MIFIAPTNWRHSGGSHDRCDTKQRQRQDDHTEHRVHSDSSPLATALTLLQRGGERLTQCP
jgi:hypothetical protein